MEVEDHGIRLAAVAHREGHGDPCLLLGQGEGAVQGMLGDDGAVGEGQDGVAKP